MLSAPIAETAVERALDNAVTATFHRNLQAGVPVVYPSPAYYNPYLRDSFWAAQALGDRAFSLTVLDRFTGALRADGAPPTWFVNAYRYPRYHDDESGALILIWAQRNQQLYSQTPPHAALQRVVDYLMRRAPDGFLHSARGRYNSWWDAFRLQRDDTLSYSQGLYAVALHCAERLHLHLSHNARRRADEAYAALYDARLGYLRLSRRIAANDASALTGEFLSLWLFGSPLLSDHVVQQTVRHLTPFDAGFRVVALPPNGDYLPTDPSGSGVPGDYQNGASWLLYDALSLATAGLHGERTALAHLRARLALEFRHGVMLHEYLRTNPLLAYYESEPPYRNVFTWDTFVQVIDRLLRQIRR